MRIAFAVFKFDPLGGKERDALTLARMFHARGHEITFVTANPAGLGERAGAVLEVPASGYTNHARMLDFSDRVAALRGSRRFDAVLGFEKIGGLDYYYGEGLCIRAMTGPLARLLPRKRALLRLEAKVFGPASKTFAFFLTETQKEQYRAAYGFPEERALVLPPALQPDRWKPATFYEERAAVRREQGVPDDAPLIVNVATFARQKGVDRIIDALVHVPEAHLLTVGLKDAAPVGRRARGKGVAPRVHVLAYSEDIPRLLGAADLMVHPARIENTGSVIIESLLFGVPVIATANCGYAGHVVRSGAGTVVPVNVSRSDLAQTIRQALQPENLGALREKARDYAGFLEKNARFDHMADVMLETIESGTAR